MAVHTTPRSVAGGGWFMKMFALEAGTVEDR
jgi:hypothetical protein